MKITICSNCRHVLNLSRIPTTERPSFLPDVLEVGFPCPHCQEWRTGFYITEELKIIPKGRKDKRRYNHKFKQLQLWVEHKKRINERRLDQAPMAAASCNQ